jgi:hypothetical protein
MVIDGPLRGRAFIYLLFVVANNHTPSVSFPFFFFFNLEQNDMFEFCLFRTGR